ncbi:ABC transporter ATP-binding protein [Castellaniella sp. S9]|uniref:ABC transporter ATP-binding protein n=1 Tax=Castellaniella sp. S9 TaxID=2993652 RepID=UPI0022B4781A|nr:oligopeptide/dipeptide ABC transporter ATP-binding protein [Castellaniella sp. S9]
MSILAGNPEELIRITNLKKSFNVVRRKGLGIEHKKLHAVNDVSFSISASQSFGIVGESGSGKSTLGRLIFGLERPTAGTIHYGGMEVNGLSEDGLHAYWRDIQIVFQDPFSSLNPRMRIGDALSEPLKNFLGMDRHARSVRADELLDLVGLPKRTIKHYPHELSGGQRQRVAIAAALAVNPKIIIADEAVSALDVSVQAQIINLLSDLRRQLGLTYIFVTHDLNLCAYFCDRIAVLYLGQIMEICEADKLLSEPRHPYTQALISAIPSVNTENRRERTILGGEIPSPLDPPTGCPFQPRCPYAIPRCKEQRPRLEETGESHLVACHVVADELNSIKERS